MSSPRIGLLVMPSPSMSMRAVMYCPLGSPSSAARLYQWAAWVMSGGRAFPSPLA